MLNRKLRLFIASYPYSGNGGYSSEHPAVRDWMIHTVLDCHGKYAEMFEPPMWKDFSDTPIPMTRNQSVLAARAMKADILIMLDSDMIPDMYLRSPYKQQNPLAALTAKPFFDVAVEELTKRWEKGPHVIAAPYCGPPPDETVYVGEWRGSMLETPDPKAKLRMMERTTAAAMTGVSNAAALPTGVIAYDMRVFEYAEPTEESNHGWFYYKYPSHYEAEKCGTEDIMATRDLAFGVMNKLGYNPLLVAWDSWAGHVKPYTVGKPGYIGVEQIEPRFAESIRQNQRADESMIVVGGDAGTPPAGVEIVKGSDVISDERFENVKLPEGPNFDPSISIPYGNSGTLKKFTITQLRNIQKRSILGLLEGDQLRDLDAVLSHFCKYVVRDTSVN